MPPRRARHFCSDMEYSGSSCSVGGMGPSATYMCPRVAKAPAKGVCVWTKGCNGAWDRGEDRTGRDARKALQ